MPQRGFDLIPVVQRSYDLCADLYQHVDRFPRAQRGLLGRVILEDALRMLSALTTANRRTDKVDRLTEASGRLDAVRIALRLSKRLGYLSNRAYAVLTPVTDEVGRMIGGWLKHEIAPPAAEPLGEPPRAARRAGGTRYTMASPTVEKYLRAKLGHPGAVVLVAVGAFYQTFFEDAVYCGRVLRFAVRNLAATSEPEKILTCGFPRTKLEHYRVALTQSGRAVHVE
jgi:hypothetical protein